MFPLFKKGNFKKCHLFLGARKAFNPPAAASAGASVCVCPHVKAFRHPVLAAGQYQEDLITGSLLTPIHQNLLFKFNQVSSMNFSLKTCSQSHVIISSFTRIELKSTHKEKIHNIVLILALSSKQLLLAPLN